MPNKKVSGKKHLDFETSNKGKPSYKFVINVRHLIQILL